MSWQQETLLLLDLSTLQGPKLHLDIDTETCSAPGLVYTTEACTAAGRVWTIGVCVGLVVSTPQGPELHLCASTLQMPVLHLDVTGKEERVLVWLLYSIGAWVYTTKACTAKAIPFIYSFSGNRAVSALISTFMCLWAIYIFPGSVYIFPPAEQADPSWEYIIRSQTHECGNCDWAPDIPFLGIFVSNFRHFVFAVWADRDVSGQQEPVLVWSSLHHRGLIWTWTCACLHYLSGQQETVMVWTSLYHRGLRWTWTCLDNTWALLLLDLYILEGPELPLALSSTWTCLHHKGLNCTYTCLDNRSLDCLWPCLHHRGLSCNWMCLDNRTLLLLDVSKLQGPKLREGGGAKSNDMAVLRSCFSDTFPSIICWNYVDWKKWRKKRWCFWTIWIKWTYILYTLVSTNSATALSF